LSENVDFARTVNAAGIIFAGPSPESIETFGLKHTARELATKANVPIVPGTQGLVQTEDEAVVTSQKLGFPVRSRLAKQSKTCAHRMVGHAQSDGRRWGHGSVDL
jgi:acetyl/propionyl-CoA carboxylase alpha subunit